jgi:hypothetical protein
MTTERFEERLMHELKNHVQQRANDPQPEGAAEGRSRRARRVRWLPVGLTSGLAAAAAGIVLTTVPAQSAAAYTLQNEKEGIVKLTIVNPGGKIDLEKLRNDMAHLGINSRVYVGDPNCHIPRNQGRPDPSAPRHPEPSPHGKVDATGKPSLVPGSRNGVGRHDPALSGGWDIGSDDGKPVLYVRPSKIPENKQLMVGFPLAKTDPVHAYSLIVAGLQDEPGPACMPSGVINLK